MKRDTKDCKMPVNCVPNIRKLALDLLVGYEEGERYVNLLLSSPKVKSLDPSSKGQLTALLYTTVEKKLTYDYLMCKISGRGIDDITPTARNIIRLGMCQILHMDSIPDFAAVNETVALGKNKGERSFINGVLRATVRCKDDLPFPDKEKSLARYLSVYYSMPQPLVKYFISLYKDEAPRLIETLSEPSGISLTVNTEKIERNELLSKISDDAKADRYSGVGIKLSSSVDPKSLYGFAEGYFFVQDEASRLAVAALSAESGMTVVDVCAAPGGKTFGAAIAVGNKGKVYSFDIHDTKLSLIDSGAERLGISDRITVHQNDARKIKEDLIGKADRVICDVPCSGLGVIAKKPDLKYKDLSSLNELPPLQYEILCQSSRYLKPSGIIVYSTCTLNPSENAEITDKFINEHPDFEYVNKPVCSLITDGGKLTLLPHVHGTDGFYIAIMRKK